MPIRRPRTAPNRPPRRPARADMDALEARLLLAAATDDLVFIHHSCGENWLNNSLDAALLAKTYIDERNDITYGTDVAPDPGRPDSLGPTPGDATDMYHWILWFNDYLASVKTYDCATGVNRIVMFKSCFPNSQIDADGTEPGDPFDSSTSLVNYMALYRHPSGSGNTYLHDGYTYLPLEDIFAANSDTLFIPVTAPPLHYGPSDATDDAAAHRARVFNNWLKNDWLASYNAAHPGLSNVAVFDWFNILAYPDDPGAPGHPNRLQGAYGGDTGNSHPNDTANALSTQLFATNPDNFLDQAWSAFATVPLTLTTPAGTSTVDRPDPFDVQWAGGGASATLALSSCGPTGWQQAATGLAAGAGHYAWATGGAPVGWHCFLARVTDGAASYDAASPGWVCVVEPAPPAPPDAPPAGEVSGGKGTFHPAGAEKLDVPVSPLWDAEGPAAPDAQDLAADAPAQTPPNGAGDAATPPSQAGADDSHSLQTPEAIGPAGLWAWLAAPDWLDVL